MAEKDYDFGLSVDTLNAIIIAIDHIKTALVAERDAHKVKADKLGQPIGASAIAKMGGAAAGAGIGDSF